MSAILQKHRNNELLSPFLTVFCTDFTSRFAEAQASQKLVKMPPKMVSPGTQNPQKPKQTEHSENHKKNWKLWKNRILIVPPCYLKKCKKKRGV